MFITSILVNIGMWLERYLLFIPSLAEKQELSFDYNQYVPSIFEFAIVFAALAMVSLGFLLFSKVFPVIPIYDIKEGQVAREEMQVGKVQVPAVMRE